MKTILKSKEGLSTEWGRQDHRLDQSNAARDCPCCKRNSGINRRAVLGFAATAMVVSSPVCAAGEHPVEPPLTLPVDRGLLSPVALTLDACSGGFDVHLLQALIDWKVPATIFVTGIWLARHPEALAQMMAHPRLFRFGNHGARHQAMVLGERLIYGQKTVGTIDAAREEVLEGGRLIEQATGVRPRWFRGATALYSPSLLPMIGSWGYRVAGFSLNGDEGATLPAQAVAARIGRAKAGDVIIAHINQPQRSSGMGVIAGVKRLVDQGFTFTSLDANV
jgi:peptidoglycan/xylan/chitin deacetylase (PgdA/CDA1 family)